MKQIAAAVLVLALLLVLAACSADTRAAERAATHVDGVILREEALTRFRAGLTPVTTLEGGDDSREALVRRFVRGLERGDTLQLASLLLTLEEFAYLYYPTTPQSLPPYDLSPGLMWFLMQGNSRKGLYRALAERGRQPLGHVGHRCDAPPSREGENTVWAPCVILRLQAPGDTAAERLFGAIIERDGRYKFLSFANGL